RWRARRRPSTRPGGAGAPRPRSRSPRNGHDVRIGAGSAAPWLCYDRFRPQTRAFSRAAHVARETSRLEMPNIKQQKKRVRLAAQQRLENLRYRSTVKTFTRRLRDAVNDGDVDRVADEHRTLVRWIDKAASHGALHRNTAARKKAQAAQVV